MSGLAVAATKGSVGATTLGFALVAGRAPDALLVEVDPDGGSLAARLGISEDPGLTSAAAACRHGQMSGRAEDHVHTARGVRVLPAPTSPRQVRSCLAAAAESLDLQVWWASRTCVLDCGRLDADSPVVPLIGGTSALVWVTRPTVEGADALAVRLAELASLPARSVLVTAGEGPYRPDEVAAALELPLIGHVPFDPRGAAWLWEDPSSRRWRRSPLGRAAYSIGEALASRYDLSPPNGPREAILARPSGPAGGNS